VFYHRGGVFIVGHFSISSASGCLDHQAQLHAWHWDYQLSSPTMSKALGLS
jgi:hypothetical protein